MEGNTKEGLEGGKGEVEETLSAAESAEQPAQVAGGVGGWGGWGFSPLSYLSDLQKAATVAAEEISRNAAAVAKTLTEVENVPEDYESSKEEKDATNKKGGDGEAVDGEDNLRKSALDKLEQASEDSFLSQGLKAIDSSVENFASGAWQVLGSALKGGSGFIEKLEQHSATNLADTVQNGGSTVFTAPSLIETGRAFTAKGMQVLENVGKETIDLLLSETGIDVEKKSDETEQADEDHEEMTFDHCFYIYGGPEQLEDLGALSSHHALLFNRKKAKLSSEQKTLYEGKLKEVQQIFDLVSETDGSASDSDKGKKIESRPEGIDSELKSLHDASVNKAADMAAGFASALSGLAATDIIQRTAGRLESLHSEGVHRLSEVCCFSTSQLLMLGKSIIANANKTQEDTNIEWPEDCVEKAKIIRTRAQSMTGSLESVSNSFVTGISDVVEAYLAAIKGSAAESDKDTLPKSVQEKASALSERLRSDQISAVSKIQEGVQFLSYVVLSASMPSV